MKKVFQFFLGICFFHAFCIQKEKEDILFTSLQGQGNITQRTNSIKTLHH